MSSIIRRLALGAVFLVSCTNHENARSNGTNTGSPPPASVNYAKQCSNQPRPAGWVVWDTEQNPSLCPASNLTAYTVYDITRYDALTKGQNLTICTFDIGAIPMGQSFGVVNQSTNDRHCIVDSITPVSANNLTTLVRF